MFLRAINARSSAIVTPIQCLFFQNGVGVPFSKCIDRVKSLGLQWSLPTRWSLRWRGGRMANNQLICCCGEIYCYVLEGWRTSQLICCVGRSIAALWKDDQQVDSEVVVAFSSHASEGLQRCSLLFLICVNPSTHPPRCASSHCCRRLLRSFPASYSEILTQWNFCPMIQHQSEPAFQLRSDSDHSSQEYQQKDQNFIQWQKLVFQDSVKNAVASEMRKRNWAKIGGARVESWWWQPCELLSWSVILWVIAALALPYWSNSDRLVEESKRRGIHITTVASWMCWISDELFVAHCRLSAWSLWCCALPT